ncbi:hypothetical protein ST201phi2-1p432 [Pseudomonas phage 201phi2-1]|uniref:Uncharacterized protein n=1 Tax=Pseudomonas phage 201phi2-1 TaxID=198110 RepID=B3FJU0_BP201|nr:hypothetical protein ST201phi2-1p432 [Pseudomonas phage 201phi2-1]ABY63255.1 hypothetical protein 201phi2-1p432 [Pseudomonas phage 201phi2-1]
MFDTSKFLINNRPAPSEQLPPKDELPFQRTQPGEPLPDIVVTFNPKDFKRVELAHLMEQGLYLGLRATVTDQNLYLLDISIKRYESQVEYCYKTEWSTILESVAGPSGIPYTVKEWAGKWGWVIQDFLKQVDDWNKC